MSMSLQELQNGLNAEIQGVKHGGFPLEVFPQKMQSLILTLASQDGFVVEFTASAMLVAAATAVGNARRLRVRGQWSVAPMFYMIFVGRPGIGKTPPLEFAFKPVVKEDQRRQEAYRKEKEAWEWLKKENQSAKKGESQIDLPEEPTLQKIVLNDFTYEAMMRIHDMNQRGIVVKFDEIIGMFKTIDRYSNSSTIEAFLSIFSGTPFSMTRCSKMEESVEIANPCVSIIGTTQTLLLSQIATQEFQSNGLLDRFLLVHPKDAKVALWDRTDTTRETVNTFDIWDGILRNLFELDYNAENPTILYMSGEAEDMFFKWHNDNATHMNSIEDDSDINTRMLKWDSIVARLALMLQLLHWACGEATGDEVELKSVEGALKLNEYYEESFNRLKKNFGGVRLSPIRKRLMSLLPEKFTSAEAVTIGSSIDFKEDGVRKALADMVKSGLLSKQLRGEYLKTSMPYT